MLMFLLIDEDKKNEDFLKLLLFNCYSCYHYYKVFLPKSSTIILFTEFFCLSTCNLLLIGNHLMKESSKCYNSNHCII